ncbi:MAG TPA: hypothetical protein PK490_21835 [Prosthecobacter sp.]|nr:hypothetical protein [Prosthecobacter sp.]
MDFSKSPDATVMNAFDLCILRADADVDLEAAHALGSRIIARINPFEIAAGSDAARAAEVLGIPMFEGVSPGSLRLDATHPHWTRLVTRVLVQKTAVRGFDGVLITGLEGIGQEAERAALLESLNALRAAFPDKILLLDGAFDLAREARRTVDGLLFTGFGNSAGTASARRQEQQVREAARLGMKAYVVGFADPENPGDLDNRARQVRELGGVPFFTTPSMDGVNLGPLREVARRVLVLHSGPVQQTFTARFLHGSLQWLGHEVVYRDIQARESAPQAHASLRGVIFDHSLAADSGKDLAALVRHLAAAGVPVLLNSLDWLAASGQVLQAELGIETGGKMPPGLKLRPLPMESAFANPSHAEPAADCRDILAVKAPEDARLVLSLRADDRQTDQVFLAPWGGVWLEPRALEKGTRIQPLSFLEAWLAGAAPAPVADTTSQDGRQLLVCHVGSEGFDAITPRPGLPMAAEVMVDEVLAKYPLPFSVAVCEGDLRGWTPGHAPAEALRREVAARELFSLPNVEPASATLSRPLDWTPGAGITRPLHESASDTRRGMEREVAGSLAWLHQQLTPGRTGGVPLIVWPEGAQPSREAVTFSRRMGVENAAVWAFEGATGCVLPPRSWSRADAFQTWLHDPRQGRALDASAIIRHAETLGAERWLAPVQVCLGFADAATDAALAQTRRLLDWCSTRPLHPVSLSAYARLARDAEHSRVFLAGPDHWILVNAGHARTFRMPASAGVPDLERCVGITGYIQHGGQIYIHTLGRQRTELRMIQSPAAQRLRLASSSGAVRWLEAGSRRAQWLVSHSRPVEMTFAGLAPGSFCQLQTDGRGEYLVADARGCVTFTAPPRATLHLQAVSDRRAAMR